MKFIALALIAGSLFAQDVPTVNSQWPSNTIYSGITARGLEVDLGRNWTHYTPGTVSSIQWRVGLSKNFDVRFNKDMGAIQTAAELSASTTVGFQQTWGKTYTKSLLLATQKLSDSVFLDVNAGFMKDTLTKGKTKIGAANLYYAKDSWAYGLDAISTKYESSTAAVQAMIWGQYLVGKNAGLWLGVNREVKLKEKATTVMAGVSFRAFSF